MIHGAAASWLESSWLQITETIPKRLPLLTTKPFSALKTLCCRSSSRRHTTATPCPAVDELGLPLMDLWSHLGPLTILRPITKRSDPYSHILWPRSVLSSSIPTTSLENLFTNLYGGFQPSCDLIVLSWSWFLYLKILLPSLSLVWLCECLNLLAPFPQFDSGYRTSLLRSAYNSLMSSSISLVLIFSAWSSRGFLGSRTLTSSELLGERLCRSQGNSGVGRFALLSFNGFGDPTVCLTSVLVPFAPICHLPPHDRMLGSGYLLQRQTDYKLCVEFLDLHGHELHVREDPPALLRFDTLFLRTPVVASSRIMRYVPKCLKDFDPRIVNPLMCLARKSLCVPSVEQSFTSSNALSARATYDHQLALISIIPKVSQYVNYKRLFLVCICSVCLD